MPRYETVIHIITDGDDMYDAGERAGEIIDGSKMENGMLISCEPTRLYMVPGRQYVGSLKEENTVEA